MKHINRLIFSILTATLIQSTSYALQGGIGDGGGQGIVCRNDDGTVASAQLLDLTEAEDYFLLNLQDQPKERPYLDIAHDYAAVLDGAIPSSVPTGQISETVGNNPAQINYDINGSIVLSKQNKYPFIRSSVDSIDSGKMLIPGNSFKIPPVGDSHPRILPSAKGCNLEQIAVYTDGNNQVHFVGSVWNQLSNVNKAALLIHEALYRSLRVMGDTTSDRARKTIAYLFSGMKFDWILDGLPQKYLFCWTNDTDASFQFAVYPSRGNFVAAQFLVYNGEIMLSKTVGYLNSALFTSKFGLTVPQQGNESIMYTIENPLLDVPNYNFAIQVDSSTGNMTTSIEAFSLMAGQNLKQITCNQQLSSITVGADGSVSVGPARP